MLKIKTFPNKSEIHSISKQNHIYNRKHLSEIKYITENVNNKEKPYIYDENIKIKFSVKNYKEDIVSLPLELKFKSKFFYPFITEYLSKVVEDYNRLYSNSNFKNFLNFKIFDILTDENDEIFFNERIRLISEEENLNIYKNINYIEDEKKKSYKLKCKMPFDMVLNDFIQNYKNYFKKTRFKEYSIGSYYLMLSKLENFFLINENCEIENFDENIKNLIHLKILEFFAFIIHYNKSKPEPEDFSNLELKLANYHEDTSNLYFELNTNDSTLYSNKKSLLKPFNKDDILLQDECEVDYGNKRYTRKAIKTRLDYMKKLITNANMELYNEVESEIIKDTSKEDKQKKVVFCIPNDRNSILNKLN